jgi:hypothetical protein
MKIGQGYIETSTIRPTIWGRLVTHWNTSLIALVERDHKQTWRYFGIAFRGREFGIVVKTNPEES